MAPAISIRYYLPDFTCFEIINDNAKLHSELPSSITARKDEATIRATTTTTTTRIGPTTATSNSSCCRWQSSPKNTQNGLRYPCRKRDDEPRMPCRRGHQRESEADDCSSTSSGSSVSTCSPNSSFTLLEEDRELLGHDQDDQDDDIIRIPPSSSITTACGVKDCECALSNNSCGNRERESNPASCSSSQNSNSTSSWSLVARQA